MMKKKCTIHDIAKRAGVSIATVSRVLNGTGGYSDEAALLVEKTAQELGYPKRPAKRTGKNQHSGGQDQKLIGVLVPDITNEYFAGIVLELQKCLWENDYAVIICNVNESREMAYRYMDILLEQKVSGIVFVCGYGWDMEHALMDYGVLGEPGNYPYEPQIPVIYIDRHPSDRNTDAIVIESDNFKGGYLAVKELLGSGCRRIGFLTDSMDMSSKKARFKGYARALERGGIQLDEDWILEVGQTDVYGVKRAVQKKLAEGWKVDGIMCTTDKLAAGAIMGVQSAGKKVPGDIKVTGFDDAGAAELFQPGITTIRQNGEQMARKATEFLTELLAGREVEKKHYIVPVTVSCRESTGK